MKEQSINTSHKVTQPADDVLNPSLALVVMIPLLTTLHCLSEENHTITLGPRAMAFERK